MTKKIEQVVTIKVIAYEDGTHGLDISSDPDFGKDAFSYAQIVAMNGIRTMKYQLENTPKSKATGEPIDITKLRKKQKPLGGKL